MTAAKSAARWSLRARILRTGGALNRRGRMGVAERRAGDMNVRCFRIDWLIPVLGIVIVVGFVVVAVTYRGLEGQADEETAFTPVLDRLCRDHGLSLVLRMMHEGSFDEAAERLDLLLCWDVMRADVEMARADARTRAWGEDILRMIARLRPKMERKTGAGPALESGDAREEAERVLERVLKEGSPQR
jgi:hypothetical protein